MSTFVLQIQDLDESGKDWSFEISAGWLKAALNDSDLHAHVGMAPGQLKVHAQRSGVDVLVQSRINARVFAECSRCLEDVPLDLGLDITTLFAPIQTRGQEPDEYDPLEEDFYRDYYSGSQIILDNLVREHLILESPMKPLCSEQCKGIEIPAHLKPPEDVFGKSARKSPFAALSRLKEKLAKSEE